MSSYGQVMDQMVEAMPPATAQAPAQNQWTLASVAHMLAFGAVAWVGGKVAEALLGDTINDFFSDSGKSAPKAKPKPRKKNATKQKPIDDDPDYDYSKDELSDFDSNDEEEIVEESDEDFDSSDEEE